MCSRWLRPRKCKVLEAERSEISVWLILVTSSCTLGGYFLSVSSWDLCFPLFSYKSTTPTVRVKPTRPHLTLLPKTIISQAIALGID